MPDTEYSLYVPTQRYGFMSRFISSMELGLPNVPSKPDILKSLFFIHIYMNASFIRLHSWWSRRNTSNLILCIQSNQTEAGFS